MSLVRVIAPLALLLGLPVLIGVGWWLPNRPVAGDVAMPSAVFNSVSFAPYRARESPLTKTFPTRAEVDQDLALLAGRSRAIRTYSAIEGDYDLPAMARAHGLKIWQGIWLGADRAANAREMAAAIKAAHNYPDVIERVVVGNEVLLRKDLPVDELIADIDHVKASVTQKVTYADVWNFFVDNPQIAPHVDIVTIHILPYWEDQPTNIAGAMAHVLDVVAKIRALFPGKPVAIGETGWPSAGRWRQDAAPSLVNEVVFLRRFIALAQANHFDYNFIEAFDQVWKYQDEGVVGARWGLLGADRRAKFPMTGPVRENAGWPVAAGLSIACGWLLFAIGAAAGAAGRGLSARRLAAVAGVAMVLGAALGFGWAGTAPVLFDVFARIAGVGNLAGQAVLAVLCVVWVAQGGGPVLRTGREATTAARVLLRGQWPASWRGAGWHAALFADLSFVFIWTAAVLQVLLFVDPRYRDFPIATFAVPLVATLVRAVRGEWPRGGGAREEWVAGGVLMACAIGSAVMEGALNMQSLGWNACALVIAAPVLWRVAGRAKA